MEADTLLAFSNYCRLCSEENNCGIDIFTVEENSEDLCTLVNRYLPVKVEDGDLYPRKICPGCHIQLEATKLFMDLIIEGQDKLRNLLKVEQDLLNREEKERQKLEQALQNHNPNASVETYTIQTDENGEKYIIQIYSEGPLFSPEHQLALKAEGLERPKRKRGRPPKTIPAEETITEPLEDEHDMELELKVEPEPSILEDPMAQRQKRKIKPPSRYDGVMQGKELVNILKEEGVIDEEIDDLEDEGPLDIDKRSLQSKNNDSATVIGKVVEDNGQAEVEELVLMKAPKSRISKVKKKSKQNKYSCNICKKEFQHFGRCEMHKRSHRVKYACTTEDCPVQADTKDVIVEHQKGTGHEGVSTFEQIIRLNGTVLLDGTVPLDEPDESVAPVPEPELLAELEQEGGKMLQCEKCDKAFTCKQNYEVHMKAVHEGEKPFKCHLCSKAFAYACSLKSHMIIHANQTDSTDSFKCDMCDKVFMHPSSLGYHKDTEHGNRKFICNKCNKSFKHRQLLLRHQMVHSDDRPFKCEQCDRHFKSKTNLINHENIHNGAKKFVCPMCGNTFLHKTSLWSHLKWHEGRKPHVCVVCQKTFSQKGNLVEHERIHTGEKPYTCSLCGRSFTTSSQCKLHMKRHTGEKPHCCKFCNKQFLHKDTFESHVRRHLDERPFHCKFCTKTFPDQWSCTRHERIHLGLKKYKCDVCNKTFTDCANFSKHKKIHLKHGIKPQNIDKPRDLIDNTVDSAEQQQQHIVDDSSEPVTDMEFEFLSSVTTTTTDDEDAAARQESPQVPGGGGGATAVINSPQLQIHDLLDHEGNPISITTADGQPIPIVSSGSEKFQGLLPDGTLVSFDIVPEEQSKEQEQTELAATPEVSLLNTEIQFLEDNSMSNSSEGLTRAKPAFLSEDGKVCFISAFDDNAFLTMN